MKQGRCAAVERLVTTTHLEMADRGQLRPARSATVPFDLVRVEIPCPQLNRFLYTAVGARWTWYSRLPWSRARWLAYLDRPEVETWVAYVSGTPAGYFELERQDEGSMEIAFFGLLPSFIGKGLGGHLLPAAATRARVMGAKRVWLHTSDLDHPRALANYQARGFMVFKVEQNVEQIPDAALEAWPGADS